MAIKDKKFYSNSLFYDYIFSHTKLRKYFCYDFHDPDVFKKRADDVYKEYNSGFRQSLSGRLAYINKSLGCSKATLTNCNSLKDPDTMVVVGGQQPGLLTGPSFIIYKIFSIIKLAENLSVHLNKKVIPVFWNASDDSNFNQANNTYLLDGDLKKVNLSLEEITRDKDEKHQKRFSDIFIPKEIVLKKIDEFLGFLPETDFKDGIKDFFTGSLKQLNEKEFTSPGAGSGKAAPESLKNSSFLKNSLRLNDFFSLLITKMFTKYGLVLIDPSDTELKKMAFPILENDICKHKNIENLITQSGSTLIKDGYHSQLFSDKDFLNFFIVKDGVRKRIRCCKDSSYIFDGLALSEDELKSLIISDFSKISLNVISRPLFQDYVLPVLATVCGPGEVSYFSQLNQVYSITGLKQPVIYPRFSATLVENKIKKAIEKTGMGFELLSQERKDAIRLLAKRNLGIDTDALLENLKDDIIRKTGSTREEMDKSGIDYGNYFDRIQENLKKEIKSLSKKILSDAENNRLFLSSSIDKIYLSLFPEGKLQERVINIFYYINKYDFKLLQDLYDNIDIRDRFHKLLFL